MKFSKRSTKIKGAFFYIQCDTTLVGTDYKIRFMVNLKQLTNKYNILTVFEIYKGNWHGRKAEVGHIQVAKNAVVDEKFIKIQIETTLKKIIKLN